MPSTEHFALSSVFVRRYGPVTGFGFDQVILVSGLVTVNFTVADVGAYPDPAGGVQITVNVCVPGDKMSPAPGA